MSYNAVPYFGKICKKHPHLKGRRGANHKRCLECAREKSRANWSRKLIERGTMDRRLPTKWDKADRKKLAQFDGIDPPIVD